MTIKQSNIDELIREHGSEEKLLMWWYSLLESWVTQTGLDNEQVEELKKYSELLLEDIKSEMEEL